MTVVKRVSAGACGLTASTPTAKTAPEVHHPNARPSPCPPRPRRGTGYTQVATLHSSHAPLPAHRHHERAVVVGTVDQYPASKRRDVSSLPSLSEAFSAHQICGSDKVPPNIPTEDALQTLSYPSREGDREPYRCDRLPRSPPPSPVYRIQLLCVGPRGAPPTTHVFQKARQQPMASGACAGRHWGNGGGGSHTMHVHELLLNSGFLPPQLGHIRLCLSFTFTNTYRI